jgi:molecular chaperone DnaK (HSP70)
MSHECEIANLPPVDTLHEYEMEESARFDRMQRDWEKLRGDPDDVFFEANDRKQEIKEQIKELHKALERQHPRRKSKKEKRRIKH